MRTINEIIIHCSATLGDRDYTVQDIDRWHRNRGWNGCGYHYVVLRDGTIQTGRPHEQIGAHCGGHNIHSIGVCYIGGLDPDTCNPTDTRTPEQKQALTDLLRVLKRLFPNATIHGHNEFSKKPCPCFDARTEYAGL